MTNPRDTPIEINKEDFIKIGYKLINSIAEYLDTVAKKTVTTSESSKEIQTILGNASMPELGTSASE